ncbi:MAG: adenosylcobinamide-phosphate synthase CbiB [Lachnospiraceae bacterium]|nr:adenosylcobinamide-phosphate synthase CbiB [Lachnospiraceae bacterium]
MRELFLFHMIAFGLGTVLDLIIGDPHKMPHPIRAIGRLIQLLEGKLLAAGNKRRERRRGALLWFLVTGAVCAVTLCLVAVSYLVNRCLGIVTETVLICYCLAAKSLRKESMAVYKKLMQQDINGARTALSMIVGRDTEVLSEEEVIKAAVETVAENTSDGVIAPLLYAAVGGPVLAMAYKAVNTMDSMIGYRNEKYEHFGFFAARADDFFNFMPSRISAVFMIAGNFILSLFCHKNPGGSVYNGKDACRIWKRDRRNHSSPNSAQTESVCAGALGLCLGGTHLYRGVAVEKPTIGEEKRKPEYDDIKRANMLMFTTEAIAFFVCMAVMSLMLLLVIR